MKLKNRIMSWILSPGAYALWHSMGNPEEWIWEEEPERFHNRNAQLYVKMSLWWTHVPASLLVVPPFCFITGPAAWAVWPFHAFYCYNHEKGIGWVDRNLIAGRAMRLRTKLIKRNYMSRKQRENRNIFTKLTVNQVAE